MLSVPVQMVHITCLEVGREMWLSVDPRSAKPVYQQVADGVKEAIAKGIVESGDRLPSVRELAVTMPLNHNTVAKAYRELEREGVIEVVQGRGTFVAASRPRPDRDARIRAMAGRIREMLIEAHHLQMSESEIQDLFSHTMRSWEEERGRTNV